MRCDLCKNQAVVHVALARERSCAEEKHLCEQHGREFADGCPRDAPAANATPRTGTVPFDIEMVVISEITESHLVYLREVNGERRFWLMVGLHEALALDRMLRQFSPPRPLTHDAWAKTIAALGGKLQDVLISHVSSHTYHARLQIQQHDAQVVDVDVRPSDALSLAVLAGVPILIAEEALAATP
jgi:uncharacterized protein